MPVRELFGRAAEAADAGGGMEGSEAKIPQSYIDEQIIREGEALLLKYRQGKMNLEQRLKEDEEWYKGRHWDALKRNGKITAGAAQPEPASEWLFNAIMNKHADAMDNIPEPVVLPRERDDKQSAKQLQQVLPVIMEYNNFEDTYSSGWWEKLKHGTGVYGVFWNGEKDNGLGDIDVKSLDLLDIYWEPGITDIQKSKNLFIVSLEDMEILESQYPQHKGKFRQNMGEKAEYYYDESIDTSDKAFVVDWYYKVRAENGKTLLHFIKYCGNALLYASENDPALRDVGWYEHGLYPLVFDVMWPEKGMPVGFGYVSVCKDPQLYIDKLQSYIMENAMMRTHPRYFVSSSTNINREEFLDSTKPLITVEGEIDDRRVKQFEVSGLDGNVLSILQMKIEEMKDTAANRDVNSGGTGSGVTAASAIAALQEAGNKVSRDIISASYRAYTKVVSLCIELMRQFYNESRAFRITGPSGALEFIEMSNASLKDQVMTLPAGNTLYRKPVFDLKVKAQKKNPFSRMEQNERAKELYAAGFFNPERAQEALACLEMMDFEGIDEVREYVKQGAALLNMVQQQSQLISQLQAHIALLTGGLNMPAEASVGPSERPEGGSRTNIPPAANKGQQGLTGGVMEANAPLQSYARNLAKRSAPSMDDLSDAAAPGRM